MTVSFKDKFLKFATFYKNRDLSLLLLLVFLIVWRRFRILLGTVRIR